MGAGATADGSRNGVGADLSARLRAALEAVLASDRDSIGRLKYARTSVTFCVEGTPARVTLLLDRSPPELLSDDESGEVEVRLTQEQAERFMCGTFHMPSALESGAVTATGPMRRYLEVDPILRGALRDLSGADEGEGAHTEPWDGRGPGLDPELAAIETRDLHKSFGPAKVLRGVDLQVPEGVVAIILGPSGTGKSVLLNHVIGLMRPTRGDVLVRGRSLNKMSRSEILALRLEVGVMFQDGALFSAMNVYDNVAFPLRQHTDLTEAEIRDVVMRHLSSVGLADSVDKRPGELSGGMRKRAGLARALVLDPGVIICDEPDSGLDPVRTALLGDLLLEQHAEMGGTMLVITHNIALAKRIGEHISVLWQGKIIESGSAAKIFGSDNEFVRQFLSSSIEGPLGMDA